MKTEEWNMNSYRLVKKKCVCERAKLLEKSNSEKDVDNLQVKKGHSG